MGPGGDAVSGTTDGDLIQWTNTTLSNLTVKLSNGERSATKSIRLHQSSINAIMVVQDQYIITGGEDGHIRLFDLKFRAIFWHEKLGAGPVCWISTNCSAANMFDDVPIPEMFICTLNGTIQMIGRPATKTTRLNTQKSIMTSTPSKGDNKRTALLGEVPTTTLILSALPGSINTLVAHPQLNQFAVAGGAGCLQVWDFVTKQMVLQRTFENMPDSAVKGWQCIQSIAYSKSGKTIAVGFVNGWLKLLDASNLLDLPQTTYDRLEAGHKISEFGLTKIAFSDDGTYCSVSDAAFVVAVLQKMPVKVKNTNQADQEYLDTGKDQVNKPPSARQRVEWCMLGRAKSHFKEVVRLLYPKCVDNEPVRMFSVSKDRHVGEYNLSASNTESGIVVLSIRRVEQIYRPMDAFLAYKEHPVHPEEFIVTVNTGFKVRSYASATRLCRQTVLGPTFGGQVAHLQPVEVNQTVGHVAFASEERVVGLMKIPSDGNPYDKVGVIGHPGAVQ